MKLNITTSEDERLTITHIAKDYNINPNGLMDTYKSVMNSNFEQDLWDIANENEEYLREEFGEYQPLKDETQDKVVVRGEKELYHIQNMNICSDGTPYDEFVFCDHFPTKDDLHKLFSDTFEDNPIDSNEQLDEFLNNSEIYKVYAEEV